VNPHVELVGQDLDARCVKITSINMGLRCRYGWVVCGNSLTGETQFAYRIGSFFNETSNGLRRGVIRDVAPEQTPVPVIADRTRRDANSLFAASDEPETAAEPTMPTIIEIPQWLARLEPRLAALDRDEPSAIEEPADKPSATPKDQPPKQKRLF
jgi:hypothetical protein